MPVTDDPVVNGKLLSDLRVVDLKEELERRGLSKAGNKTILQARLKQVSRVKTIIVHWKERNGKFALY